MSGKVQKNVMQEEKYKTTFSENVNYDVAEDFISLSYLELFIDKISNRLSIDRSDIEVSILRGDHYVIIHPDSLSAVFQETAKNNHIIANVQIKSGIQHFDKISYGSIDATITLGVENSYPHKTRVDMRVYAVGENKSSSQTIVDWGRGTLRDFRQLESFRQQLDEDELVIDESTRKVIKRHMTKDEMPALVHVVNKVDIKDNGFKEFKKPHIFIAAIFAVIAIILAYFQIISQ